MYTPNYIFFFYCAALDHSRNHSQRGKKKLYERLHDGRRYKKYESFYSYEKEINGSFILQRFIDTQSKGKFFFFLFFLKKNLSFSFSEDSGPVFLNSPLNDTKYDIRYVFDNKTKRRPH